LSSWWADKGDGSDLPASRVVADTEVAPDQQVHPPEPWMDIGQLRWVVGCVDERLISSVYIV
jgi:hypothetical protein